MDLLWKLFPLYVIVLLLIQLVPVRINLFFNRDNKDDFITIRVNTFFSLIRFTVEVPVLKQNTPLDLTVEAEVKAGQDTFIADEKEKVSALDLEWEKIREYLAYIQNNRQTLWFVFRFLTRAITVEKLVLRVRSGLDDAAMTGVLSGLYWIVTGWLTAMAQQWLRLKEKPVFSISSDFSPQPVFAARFDSVVSFRIGHVTVVGILLLFTKFRGGNV